MVQLANTEMAAVELALKQLDAPEVDGVTYGEVIEAGEHLPGMAALWDVATVEERYEMVTIVLEPGGLYYDLENKIIAALKPRPAFLPVLRLLNGIVEFDETRGLLVTDHWCERNRRVLNLVSVELFVLLVNRMGQPSLECWSDRSGNEGDQASDDPQDDQRDRQTSSINASSFMKGSSFVSLHMVRMDDLRSQYNEEDFL